MRTQPRCHRCLRHRTFPSTSFRNGISTGLRTREGSAWAFPQRPRLSSRSFHQGVDASQKARFASCGSTIAAAQMYV
jgi:hypothetical protein